MHYIQSNHIISKRDISNYCIYQTAGTSPSKAQHKSMRQLYKNKLSPLQYFAYQTMHGASVESFLHGTPITGHSGSDERMCGRHPFFLLQPHPHLLTHLSHPSPLHQRSVSLTTVLLDLLLAMTCMHCTFFCNCRQKSNFCPYRG